MLIIPDFPAPIIEIPLEHKGVTLFLKREDLIDSEISGNKYWKLFYNVNQYLERNDTHPMLITFGGAFSNHIAATAALGNKLNVKTLGIIRGEELAVKYAQNATLRFTESKGMRFRFVSRSDYRDKQKLTEILTNEFPDALTVPEGGTNSEAVKGIQHMLTEQTKDFDYLCSAVGTGGTLAGLSKYCEGNQKVMGFVVVNDASLAEKISDLSGKNNFELFEAHEGGYGKMSDELIRFINSFGKDYGIPLDPVYTGKMMRKLLLMIDDGCFPEGSRILAFHTGGLQGIVGANEMLRKQNRKTIDRY